LCHLVPRRSGTARLARVVSIRLTNGTLPDYRDIVLGEHLVDRNDVTELSQRLSHHNAGPGIAMRPGKRRGGKGVNERDGHGSDAVSLQAARQALGQGGQSSQALFVGYFVPDTGAGEDLIVRIGDRGFSGAGQPRIVRQPPQQRVGIDQQPHDLGRRGRVIPNSSVYFPPAASRSAGSMGSKRASLGSFQPRQAPLLRGVRFSIGTSRANGLPARAMTISSPA